MGSKTHNMPAVVLLLCLVALSPPPAVRAMPDTVAGQNERIATVTHTLERALAALRKGRQPSANERDNCHNLFIQHLELLSSRHKTEKSHHFPEPDRTIYYLNATKMSLLYPEKHGGWPYRSELCQTVKKELQRRLDEKYDPLTAYSALFPALMRDEAAYAAAIYETLAQKDPFLAGKVIEWSVTFRGDLNWLATYLLDNGKNDELRQVIAAVEKIGTDKSHIMASRLYERLRDFPAANAALRHIKSDIWHIDTATTLYSRYPEAKDAAGATFTQLRNTLRDKLFLNGIAKVTLTSFTAPPENGITFTDSNYNLAALGIRPGDVIVAIDGCRIANVLQYNFIQRSDPDNDQLTLIFWNGRQYKEVIAKVKDRRFGARSESYSP